MMETCLHGLPLPSSILGFSTRICYKIWHLVSWAGAVGQFSCLWKVLVNCLWTARGGVPPTSCPGLSLGGLRASNQPGGLWRDLSHL